MVYILVYTLCLLPFARYLVALQEWCRTLFSEKFESHKLTHILLLSLPVTSFLLFVFILKPQFASTHALINDWANHQLYFSLFLLGFIVAKSERFWQVIAKALPFTLLFVITSVLLASLVWYLEAINYWTPTFDVIERYSERNRKTFYAWYMMITLLAVAQRWLNKPSSLLTYANEAVFPFYILHQTLIVMFGYWLTRQGLSMGAEFISLALLTILGCMVIYEFGIRRWNVVRPLFGVKLIKYNSLKKATS